MSPDINFRQFTQEELRKITALGEDGAGHSLLQKASAVLVWIALPQAFETELKDPNMMNLSMTPTEIAVFEQALGHKIDVKTSPT